MSDILNRMSVTAFLEKQEEETLPVDDLRHCPGWMRISEKPITRTRKEYSRPKRTRPRKSAKRLFAFRDGQQLYEKSHIVSELAEMLALPVGTINATIARNTKECRGQTRFGYSFELER